MSEQGHDDLIARLGNTGTNLIETRPELGALINEAATALSAAVERERVLREERAESMVLAYKWMVAHDSLKAGLPYDFPTPADLPEMVRVLREALRKIIKVSERDHANPAAYYSATQKSIDAARAALGEP